MNNKENIINSEYKNLINSLKKCQIYFDCPILQKRLEEVSDMSNYNRVVQRQKYSEFEKKIIRYFLFFIKKIQSKYGITRLMRFFMDNASLKDIELHNLKYEKLMNEDPNSIFKPRINVLSLFQKKNKKD